MTVRRGLRGVWCIEVSFHLPFFFFFTFSRRRNHSVSDRSAPPLPWISLGLDEVGASGELAYWAGFLSADSATELREQSYKQRSMQYPPCLARPDQSLPLEVYNVKYHAWGWCFWDSKWVRKVSWFCIYTFKQFKQMCTFFSFCYKSCWKKHNTMNLWSNNQETAKFRQKRRGSSVRKERKLKVRKSLLPE